MSQFPNQFSAPQGYGPNGPQGPQDYRSGNNSGGSGSKTAIIVIAIVAGVFFIGLAVCGILAALLLPAVQMARESARSMADSNKMKEIGLALHNYGAAYRVLPAPVAVNSKKEKVWSWSVSIMPYCEHVEIYSSVNFMDMKPWNDPSNPILQGPAPSCLQSVRADTSDDCHVFIISAPALQPNKNPFFVEGTYTKFSDVVDGTSNTIMTIQLVKHSVPWASPTTLSVEEAFRLIQNEDRYVLVGMVDGSVRKIPSTIDFETFSAMVTRDGAEVVNVPYID